MSDARLDALVERIEWSAEMLDEVVKHLNVESSPCPTCKREHYESWDEYLASEALSAAARRLRRTAEKLDRLGEER